MAVPTVEEFKDNRPQAAPASKTASTPKGFLSFERGQEYYVSGGDKVLDFFTGIGVYILLGLLQWILTIPGYWMGYGGMILSWIVSILGFAALVFAIVFAFIYGRKWIAIGLLTAVVLTIVLVVVFIIMLMIAFGGLF
jgi:hypothetical protein